MQVELFLTTQFSFNDLYYPYRYQFEHLISDELCENTIFWSDKIVEQQHLGISFCIRNHNKAIRWLIGYVNVWNKKSNTSVFFFHRFVNHLESLYSIPFFIQLGLNITALSFCLVQVSWNIESNVEFDTEISCFHVEQMSLSTQKEDIMKHFIFVLGQLAHLLCRNYPGQQIMDHSTDFSLSV